jgi:hemerythrin-like domain-containing protein
MTMEARKPVRRHTALQGWSREHHDTLMFCLKIRQGLARHVEPARISAYLIWTWENSIQTHFRSEEEELFPLIGTNHPMVRRALKEHEKIEMLFLKTPHDDETIQLLERSLEAHIRFEERELFELMQEDLSQEVLNAVQHRRPGSVSCPTKTPDTPNVWHDAFWMNPN